MTGRAKRGFFNGDGLWIQYWAPIPDDEPEPESEQPDYTAELILAMSTLTEKQRFVIELRYGLRGDLEPMTLCEIATLMGVSHQAVVQLERRAMRGLQRSTMGANHRFLDTERPAAAGLPESE